jgi:hypothetical protein
VVSGVWFGLVCVWCVVVGLANSKLKRQKPSQKGVEGRNLPVGFASIFGPLDGKTIRSRDHRHKNSSSGEHRQEQIHTNQL